MTMRIAHAAPALAVLALLSAGLPEAAPQNTAPQAGYAGSETCAVCHEETERAFRRSPHWAPAGVRGGKGILMGCESCHGPGEKHAEDQSQPVFAFREESPARRSAQCLSCHATRKESSFRHSPHERSGVACDACHSSGHELGGTRRASLLRMPEQDLCLSCHSEQRAQVLLPFRHRSADGTVRCSDCHDAHGRSVRQVRRRRAQEEACYRCHTDKQGPFVFEHLASTVTGCVSCHQPHGSTNPRLLTRSEVRFVCLECHPNTTSVHDLGSARFQNCTVCHTAIHGSHVDRRFLR